MASQPQSQVQARAKERRVANNNYQRVSKALYEKLAKLCWEYDADIYFLAQRKGRFNGFVSAGKTGQPGYHHLNRLYYEVTIPLPTSSTWASKEKTDQTNMVNGGAGHFHAEGQRAPYSVELWIAMCLREFVALSECVDGLALRKVTLPTRKEMSYKSF
ncbi:hypothetical protein GQ44DRAFT_725916 [Phaeosphaeriaceae sp. PMI808]|nr:hypothetical protein GQ44DRAFT_725916 [Phaeosphaeriaceae sp. PMI808]